MRPPLLARRTDSGLMIDGLIVPWDTEITYRGRPESFAPDSLAPHPSAAVPLDIGHGSEPDAWADAAARPDGTAAMPVGRLVEWVSDGLGLWGTFEMVDTARGREAWALAESGVYKGLSAMFANTSPSAPADAGQGGQGRVTSAVLTSVALTPHPAYDAALVVRVSTGSRSRSRATLAARNRRLLEGSRHRR